MTDNVMRCVAFLTVTVRRHAPKASRKWMILVSSYGIAARHEGVDYSLYCQG